MQLEDVVTAATALTPLRLVRLDPAHAALAVALMIRSIPYLMGSVDDARDAARARGLERNPARLLTPVVLGAVGYAERTGEADHHGHFETARTSPSLSATSADVADLAIYARHGARAQ